MNETQQLDEIYTRLRAKKSIAALFTGLIIAEAVFLFAMAFIKPPLVFLGFAMLFLTAKPCRSYTKAYSDDYKESVVRHLTLDHCDFLQDLSFRPEEGLSAMEIGSLHIVDGDHFESKNLISARYHGVFFRQSDVSVTRTEFSADHTRDETTVFRGRILVFDLERPVAATLQILPKWAARLSKSRSLLPFGKQNDRVLTGDATFDQAYHVFCDDPAEVQRTVTAQMTAALMQLKQQLKSQMMLVFSEERLYIAISRNEDSFEGKIFGKISFEEDQKRILSDLRLICDFADALGL